MPSLVTFTPPDDYELARDVCSYGYFLLAPNRWDPRARTLSRFFDLPGGPAQGVLAQPDGRGRRVLLTLDRALERHERAEIRRQVVRMLRFDDAGVQEFHRLDPRWKASGRGRLFRSPTFFEDLVKTVTSCNVAWPSTIRMNERLCTVVNPAFPRATQLARRRPGTLRARCGVGYRDVRIVELARLAAAGEIDPERLEDPSLDDETVRADLLELPGIGPYAANNLLQLLGRYAHVPIDSESVRHGKAVLGLRGSTREVERAVRGHFEAFGRQRFRSYWFELWDFYERRRGPSWTWDPDSTGRTFTASALRED